MLRSTSFLAVFVLLVGASHALVTTVQAVTIETVPVGNTGNTGDTEVMSTDGTTGYGSVNYAYNIGTYEVTAGQYTTFLNAVAANDPYGLYNSEMSLDTYGCKIQQSGSSGSYEYSVPTYYPDRPVNYVSWGDAARFANWLHNGQPIGMLTGNPVLDAGLTEDGAYNLNGAMSAAELLAVTRKPGATWAIPTEDEWYKAAYYDPNYGGQGVSGYWDYPMKSDDPNVPSNDLDGGGNNATFYDSDYTIGSPYYRTEVGAHVNSDSPYGTFDQGGNVWEWNEGDISGSYRGWRGGSFVSYDVIDPLRASTRGIVDTPTFALRNVGFRVAQVPEPSALVLCSVLAGFGVAFKLKRGRS